MDCRGMVISPCSTLEYSFLGCNHISMFGGINRNLDYWLCTAAYKNILSTMIGQFFVFKGISKWTWQTTCHDNWSVWVFFFFLCAFCFFNGIFKLHSQPKCCQCLKWISPTDGKPKLAVCHWEWVVAQFVPDNWTVHWSTVLAWVVK